MKNYKNLFVIVLAGLLLAGLGLLVYSQTNKKRIEDSPKEALKVLEISNFPSPKPPTPPLIPLMPN